jgi:DNA modification methylase
VLEGDCLEQLRVLPSELVQVCVTSPPYWGVRDYGVDGQLGGEAAVDDYILGLADRFREVKRILREDGVLFLNVGDGYTSGNRKWRAPDKKNRHRAMAMRPDTPDGLKPKDLLLLPARVAATLQAPYLACTGCGATAHSFRWGLLPDRSRTCPRCWTPRPSEVVDSGWYLRSEIIWERPNCQPESVKDRPTRSYETIYLLSKSKRYFYDSTALREPAGNGATRNLRNVWRVNITKGRTGHAAPFPQALAAICISLGSRPGDIVLDPFVGSGTTALVAHRLGRKAIGVELNPSYAATARQAISNCPVHTEHSTVPDELERLLTGTGIWTVR